MMMMMIEIVAAVVVGVAVGWWLGWWLKPVPAREPESRGGAHPYRGGETPPSSPQDEGVPVIAWNVDHHKVLGGGKYVGCFCQKCLLITPIREALSELCGCTRHERPHFHFECVRCHYRAIMRTADDNPTPLASAESTVQSAATEKKA